MYTQHRTVIDPSLSSRNVVYGTACSPPIPWPFPSAPRSFPLHSSHYPHCISGGGITMADESGSPLLTSDNYITATNITETRPLLLWDLQQCRSPYLNQRCSSSPSPSSNMRPTQATVALQHSSTYIPLCPGSAPTPRPWWAGRRTKGRGRIGCGEGQHSAPIVGGACQLQCLPTVAPGRPAERRDRSRNK